jgi:homoserine dehydrogenase
MKDIRLALIGFGNVGQGFVQILQQQGERLAAQFGIHIHIVAVGTRSRGSLYDPAGLLLDDLVEAAQQGSLTALDAPYKGWDALRIIRECDVDGVAEVSYTDLITGQPALSHIQAALETGKHVVTANKGPIALHYPQLSQLAQSRGLGLGVEGTVMAGTPALHLGMDLLMAAGIRRVQGILNGTTNYILTQMEAGGSYSDALAEAQAKGYAEADPTGDVEGYDAAAKVVIIANLLLNLPLTLTDIDRQGISQLTPADIQAARDAGQRWKLIGLVEKRDDGYTAQVKPTRIPLAHPMAGISGATNAITYTTDLMGDITLIGAGAGRVETGYALLLDLLRIVG